LPIRLMTPFRSVKKPHSGRPMIWYLPIAQRGVTVVSSSTMFSLCNSRRQARRVPRSSRPRIQSGRFPTLLGHTFEVGDRPLRRETGRLFPARQLALSQDRTFDAMIDTTARNRAYASYHRWPLHKDFTFPADVVASTDCKSTGSNASSTFTSQQVAPCWTQKAYGRPTAAVLLERNRITCLAVAAGQSPCLRGVDRRPRTACRSADR
jgi:hypothetical protein